MTSENHDLCKLDASSQLAITQASPVPANLAVAMLLERANPLDCSLPALLAD
jgi:hypothetical protein